MASHSRDEPVSRTDRTDHWRTHIEAQRLGTVSQRAYCEANKIAYSTFTYWRRRLAGSDRTTNVAVGAPVRAPQAPGSAFVPVTVRPVSTTSPASAASVTVVLPGGVRIEGVHAGCVGVVTALADAL